MSEVRVGVLGSAVAVVDGVRHEPGAARHRALLTVLALHAGQAVPAPAIISAVWGDAAPAGAAVTLQGYVADLRRVLEPHRAPREAARVLVTVPAGYALRLDPDALDLTRFEMAVREAARDLRVVRDRLRPWVDPADRDTVRRAADRLDAALAEWRGEPLSDLGADLDVEVERDRLRTLRLEAEVLRHTAHLALGRHAQAVADLERLARAHPWNEVVWGLWAFALVATGQQAEALGCLRRLRASLADELGIDPGAALQELELAIIRQELAPPVRASVADPAPAVRAPAWPLVGRHAETALLEDALVLAEGGHGRLVHLTGEHGIGKTRVVHELEASARRRGFAVARASCMSEAAGEDHWAARLLLARLRELDHGAARSPAPAPRADGEPPAALVLGEQAVQLVHAVTRRTPLLLVVEDAQLADEPSLRALAHLVTAVEDRNLVLLVTQRMARGLPRGAMAALVGSLARRHAFHLELPGLEVEEVTTLAGAVSGVRVHPRAAADLTRRTGGNPFLVIELARDGDFTRGRLPASVRAVVAHHLAHLSRPVLDLLGGASLMEDEIEAAVLALAAGVTPGDVHDVLTDAVAAGVLDELCPDRYAFRQPLVREVVAASLPHGTGARWRSRIEAAEAAGPGAGPDDVVARHGRGERVSALA
jgi:DNA-binding SARP family transcriptional activator